MAEAIGARRGQHFVARQDILLFQTAAGGVTELGTHIVADVARDGCRLRLSYLLPAAVARRIVVDDTHVLQQWEPSRRLVLVEQSHEETPGAQRRMLSLMHRNYCCVPLCVECVNGLPCDSILIRPRRRPGGGKRIWVDRIHHAILRTEEYNAAGRRCYLSLYETIRFVRPLPAALFHLTGMGRVRRLPRLMRDLPSCQAAFAAAGLRGRLPAWLPLGYALIGCGALAGRSGVGQAAMLRYGDGLRAFSVFEEKAPRPGLRPDGAAPRGGLAPDGQRMWERTASGVSVTVLGNAMLPQSLGEVVLGSFLPDTEEALRSRLAHDFGAGALARAAVLRGRGWGYEQIVSLDLYLRAHPGDARTAARWARARDWGQIMSGLRAPAEPLEQQADAWIAATLRAHRGPEH